MANVRHSAQLELFGDPPEAVYSPCRNYRYLLTRTWERSGSSINFLMLNPSTATAVENDPTVWRCIQRAKRLGFGRVIVTNLFAYRATNPEDMLAQKDPVGPDNDQVILENAQAADMVVCAWGVHGEHMGRDLYVLETLLKNRIELHALGLTDSGAPRHPLYLPNDADPFKWDPDIQTSVSTRTRRRKRIA